MVTPPPRGADRPQAGGAPPARSPSLAPGAPQPLTLDHLPGLLAVQQACYGAGYVENAEVFARRLQCPAQCSRVVLRGTTVCAYLAAYASVLGKVTALHGDFEPVAAPDTLYLHDMAVLPALAGQGLAARLLSATWPVARAMGLRHTALVAVQGAQGYWARHGYAPQPLTDPEHQDRLAGYGADAVYMVRPLEGRLPG